MSEEREFALIPTRILGYARITSSLEDEPRFTIASPAASPASSLEGSKLPQPVVKFLTGLDEKLDMILSHQSLALVERDYPIKLDVRMICAEEMHFRPTDQVQDGDWLEVVFLLSHSPVRMAVAKGSVQEHLEDDVVTHCSLAYSSIRDNDRESLVSFSFAEEREQIRRRNKISG